VTMPKLPLAQLVEATITWMHANLQELFRGITTVIVGFDAVLRAGLLAVPPLVLVAAVGVLVYRRSGVRVATALSLGLLLVWDLRLWQPAMETLSLVLVAAALALLIAIPLGILVAEHPRLQTAITPILDYMQTTPSFVYLIPSVLFFGLGTVPGVLATMMYAVPPPVRLTALGIVQVEREMIEAGEAFGCGRWQLLRKVKWPLALPSILLGVNQCIMMSLSSVVIASLIGARGLGTSVIRAITQLQISEGIEAGLAVVVLAMVLDRVTRGTVRGRETSWV
jgi:glycine betaine/proline transport system permease protein